MRGPTFETWRWRSDIVSWSFTLPALPGERMTECLERVLTMSFRILPPFARFRDIVISTRDRGDDAYRFEGPAIAAAQLHHAVVDPGQVHVVRVDLDLAVFATSDDTETWLPDAATMSFELDEQSEQDQSVKMWLSLDVDIYSPTTWGENRDNAELARLNGPRLSQFLAAIRQQLDAKLEDIDVGDYKGHVDENGFH